MGCWEQQTTLICFHLILYAHVLLHLFHLSFGFWVIHHLGKDCYHLKWKSSVNFINILLKAFTGTDCKSVKIQSSCQYLFALLGSARVKDASELLMKSPPNVLKVFNVWNSICQTNSLHRCGKCWCTVRHSRNREKAALLSVY